MFLALSELSIFVQLSWLQTLFIKISQITPLISWAGTYLSGLADNTARIILQALFLGPKFSRPFLLGHCRQYCSFTFAGTFSWPKVSRPYLLGHSELTGIRILELRWGKSLLSVANHFSLAARLPSRHLKNEIVSFLQTCFLCPI